MINFCCVQNQGVLMKILAQMKVKVKIGMNWKKKQGEVSCEKIHFFNILISILVACDIHYTFPDIGSQYYAYGSIHTSFSSKFVAYSFPAIESCIKGVFIEWYLVNCLKVYKILLFCFITQYVFELLTLILSQTLVILFKICKFYFLG